MKQEEVEYNNAFSMMCCTTPLSNFAPFGFSLIYSHALGKGIIPECRNGNSHLDHASIFPVHDSMLASPILTLRNADL